MKLDQTNLPGSKGGDGGEIVAVFRKQDIYFALIYKFATLTDKS